MFLFFVIIFILTINYTQQYKLGKLLIVFIFYIIVNTKTLSLFLP